MAEEGDGDPQPPSPCRPRGLSQSFHLNVSCSSPVPCLQVLLQGQHLFGGLGVGGVSEGDPQFAAPLPWEQDGAPCPGRHLQDGKRAARGTNHSGA